MDEDEYGKNVFEENFSFPLSCIKEKNSEFTVKFYYVICYYFIF